MAKTPFLAVALATLLSASAYAAHDEYARVEMRGTLRSSIGYGNLRTYWLEVDGDRYHLYLSDPRERRRAHRFVNEEVSVVGNLDLRRSGSQTTALVDVSSLRGEERRSTDVRYDRDTTITVPVPRVRFR
jgi:hypothetical protein